MDTQNPRTGKGARAEKVHSGGLHGPTKKHPNLQPLDEVTRLQALALIHQFAMRPELASICAALAFQVRP